MWSDTVTDRLTGAPGTLPWYATAALVLVVVLVLIGLVGLRPSPARRTSGARTSAPSARTIEEAHLAMSLRPCACGATDFARTTAIVDGGGERLLHRYSGPCTSCGAPREFTFHIPDEAFGMHLGEFRYGDGGPSRLLDPGEWLAVAGHYARLSPADVSGLDAAGRRAARQQLVRAAAAMDEVLAFVPSGRSRVPASAFVSPIGRRIQAQEPGRFDRRRLEVVRDTYRQVLAEMPDAASGGRGPVP